MRYFLSPMAVDKGLWGAVWLYTVSEDGPESRGLECYEREPQAAWT
jgi:hypothetical protein